MGFTLIELLLMVVVLGILAAVVVFNLVGVFNSGGNAACNTELKGVQTAVSAYYDDNRGAYPTANGTAPGTVVMSKLMPTYLRTPPNSTGAITLKADGTALAANC